MRPTLPTDTKAHRTQPSAWRLPTPHALNAQAAQHPALRPATSGHATLRRTPHNGWSIDLTHTDKGPHVAAIMGTAILPLPFTEHADHAMVRRHVRAIEPNIEIR